MSYATEFVKCICDGTKGDGILGQEKMMESVNICGGCATTPSVIKGNLGVSSHFRQGSHIVSLMYVPADGRLSSSYSCVRVSRRASRTKAS